MKKSINEDLIRAYMDTTFRCSDIALDIFIGSTCPKLDEILRKEHLLTASFITAWNPQSVTLSEDENQYRNRSLEKDIKHFKYYHGVGKGKVGHSEDSFLILGISFEDSKMLQRKYDQKAIVFYQIGLPAKLIFD